MEPRTVTIKEASYGEQSAFRRSEGERNVGGPQERLRVVYEDILGVQTTIELSYDALRDLDEQMHTEMADIIADKAIGIATEGRPGPVHIDVPISVADMRVTPPRLRRRPDAVPMQPAAPQAARDWLAAAERPLMIVGLDAVNEGLHTVDDTVHIHAHYRRRLPGFNPGPSDVEGDPHVGLVRPHLLHRQSVFAEVVSMVR